MAAAVVGAAKPGRIINLSHIKAPLPAPAKKPARMAHPETVVTTNKEWATARFLRKKQAKGLVLSYLELALLEKYKDVDISVTPATEPPASEAGAGVGAKRKRAPEPVPALEVPFEKRIGMSLDELIAARSKAGSAPKAARSGDAEPAASVGGRGGSPGPGRRKAMGGAGGHGKPSGGGRR